MFAAKGIESYHFFLIFFSIVLADSVAIQQFVFNRIRIIPLLPYLLPSHCLFHHSHNYLLQVVEGNEISGNLVSCVVIVILFEE